MKRVSIIDVVVSVIVTAVVISALAPAFARIQRSPADAKCQSNMKRWADAMLAYANDNNNCLPTNRLIGGYLGTVSPSVKLTPPGLTGLNGQQVKFMYGFDWVSALYDYIISSAKKTDRYSSAGRSWDSFFKCPNAVGAPFPSSSAMMTYAFNCNLVEASLSRAKDASQLMMLREMDRPQEAVLRPTNFSANAATIPISPFLTDTDSKMKLQTYPHQHANGSYIVFADGHIRYFDSAYFPNDSEITSALCWDNTTNQWYNYVTNSNPAFNKAITITP